IRYAIERKRGEIKLAHDAVHDPLTSLPNRTLLTDRLRMAMARSARRKSLFAVLFLDLDHFKLVNDSLGHLAGDELLVQAAARLQEAVRPGDTVARISGDEFVILCEDVAGAEHAERIAARAADALSIPFQIEDRRVGASASIGIAVSRGELLSPEELLRNADTALYRAKEAGRARHVVFDDH